MSDSQFTRRDFGKLSMAAFGGAAAGVGLTGCGKKDEGGGTTPPPSTGGTTPPADKPAEVVDAKLLMEEPHVCRGLNTCMGKGKGGGNACAGQGACATAEAHSCKGENKCKGQGGCGESAGRNACSGKGACAVPLMDKAWTKTRAAFEEQMKAAGKTVGAAPAAGG